LHPDTHSVELAVAARFCLAVDVAGRGKNVFYAQHSPSGWKPLLVVRQLRHEWNSCPSPSWRESELFRKRLADLGFRGRECIASGVVLLLTLGDGEGNHE